MGERKEKSMKLKSLYLVAIFVLGLFWGGECRAQVRFRSGSMEELQQAAESESKFIFVQLYATWCAPCKNMLNNVFPQKRVGEFMNRHFISAKFNVERGLGAILANEYEVDSIPVSLIFDSKGNFIDKVVLSCTEEEFLQYMKIILKELKERY